MPTCSAGFTALEPRLQRSLLCIGTQNTSNGLGSFFAAQSVLQTTCTLDHM